MDENKQKLRRISELDKHVTFVVFYPEISKRGFNKVYKHAVLFSKKT